MPYTPNHHAKPRSLLLLHRVSSEVRAGLGSALAVLRTLDNVSITVHAGELLLLRGGVASGAHTLVNALAGDLAIQSGERHAAPGVRARRATISRDAAGAIRVGWLEAANVPEPPAPGPSVVHFLRVRSQGGPLNGSGYGMPGASFAASQWRRWAAHVRATGGSIVLHATVHIPIHIPRRDSRPQRSVVREVRIASVSRSGAGIADVPRLRTIAPHSPFRVLTMAAGRIIGESTHDENNGYRRAQRHRVVSEGSAATVHSSMLPPSIKSMSVLPDSVVQPAATMPEFRLYNTLTRRVEPFAPADGKTVRMYTCGPTVYNFAHLGNFRTFLFEDLLRRAIRLAGWQVQQVMNLTDVDDKIINKAAREGKTITEVTEPFTKQFHADRRYLRIEDAEQYPEATTHIPEMIALVERLVANGVAYMAEDGSVYFAIDRFANYGQLSQLDKRELRSGAGGRVAQDEYAKENAQDFALWKAAKAEDEATGAAWDSPWGRGRPGWHLECSAMAMKYLGETFDLHAGGIDLIFPHHEDEIAQSEAATGKTFARCWSHGEFLLTDGTKMAKRVGNVANVVELREQGISGTVYRHFVFSAHYRQQLNLGEDALEASQAAVRRIGIFADRLAEAAGGTAGLAEAATRAEQTFIEALHDDLNAPRAVAALFTFITDANRELDAGGDDKAALERARAAFRLMDSVLDLVPERTVDVELAAWVEERLAARRAARERRDFGMSDAIRDEITARGVLIEDGAAGTRWRQA